MLLKSVGESSLLSKDEPLTSNIDKTKSNERIQIQFSTLCAESLTLFFVLEEQMSVVRYTESQFLLMTRTTCQVNLKRFTYLKFQHKLNLLFDPKCPVPRQYKETPKTKKQLRLLCTTMYLHN